MSLADEFWIVFHLYHHHWQSITFWAVALVDSARLVCSVVDYTVRVSLLWISQHSKVVSLASKPQLGGPGPCICVPQ
jgi:hypothetical protein